VNDRRPTTELIWVLRPAADRPEQLRQRTGQRVHAIGSFGPDGEAEVVLSDGTHLRATRTEVVTE
jgi:hypothetical protein